jgi:hypothetical protein
MSKKKAKKQPAAPAAAASSSPAVPPRGEPGFTTKGPRFADPTTTPDPRKFSVKHGSDKEAYSLLDQMKGKLRPRPFPVVEGVAEPTLRLADAYGEPGESIVADIERAKQLVFHVVGDTGNTRGPKDQSLVADKMVADYDDTDPRQVPSFLYHVGDVVYSFGESMYYYDQFYEPYREYPAPIFAIAGNHDGMVAPNSTAESLSAFRANFCTAGQDPHRTPEAGELARTAQVQPGIYFTLDAPFVRILGLYSNCLEDPGIISSQDGTYPELVDAQLDFLKAGLARIKAEKYTGAVIIAVHHPPYVAQISAKARKTTSTGRHGGSPLLLDDIDAACKATGVWPHAVLSGHAHNYQRFTRIRDGRETPFLVVGNSGHGLTRLTRGETPTIRTPIDQPSLSSDGDRVTFENYDDSDYGYLRLIVNDQQLRLEYHPMTDGSASKTPDDHVTVDLATRKIAYYQAN